MCGIAAIIWPTARGADDWTELKRREVAVLDMLVPIRHRGDVEHFGEVAVRPGAAMGTNRLAIVDREHAAQPMTVAGGAIRVVFNGEIYNYRELKAELARLGHVFRTDSDTEVIARGYAAWGFELLSRLDGIFAFVVHDARRSTFLAARDHAGIKPLYLARDGAAYHFASEQKSLVRLGLEIEAVPPGSAIDHGEVRRYFHLPPVAPLAGSERQVAERCRDLFVDAVRKQVQTDLPIAVIFSGGLDSALVLHVARRFHRDITAVTVGFEGSEDIEVASRYCREFGVKHEIHHFSRAELIDVLPRAIYFGEFFEGIDIIDISISNFAYQVVNRLGIKVALTGDGSDEVFAGYDLFRRHDNKDGLMRYRIGNLHRTDLQRVDRASMMHSVEARVPFLDRRFLEFGCSIPMELKLVNGVEKWILREAFRGDVPDYLVNRPKVRMPDGSGVRGLLMEHADRAVDLPAEISRRLSLDTRQSAFFLSEYLRSGFPMPKERTKRAHLDYTTNGYFDFVARDVAR
jgi:asparagine synthase (glutamine-hydrolysing)